MEFDSWAICLAVTILALIVVPQLLSSGSHSKRRLD